MMRRSSHLDAILTVAAISLAGVLVPSIASAKSLIDYFQTTPIINQITTASWGASTNQKRDQDNGLEDKTNKSWSYWDGRIVKAADGKFHLYCSRWPESKGHWGGWPGSVCTHAISDSNLLGPYEQKGDCYTDANNQGHNVMAGTLPDNSYFILVSETRRPAIFYKSTSLDGPWSRAGTLSFALNGFSTDGQSSSNTTIWPDSDGSVLLTARDGVVMKSTGGLTAQYKVVTKSVWDSSIRYTSGGTPEDPCIWKSGGQYHIVYSYPLDRKMYHLMSKDGINNWKNMGLATDATKALVKYTDGTTNIWNKLERPQVYMENGHVTAFSFAAIDVDKNNDNGGDSHSSKIIVVPFDGVAFDKEIAGDTSAGTGGSGGSTGTGGATGGSTGTGARGGTVGSSGGAPVSSSAGTAGGGGGGRPSSGGGVTATSSSSTVTGGAGEGGSSTSIPTSSGGKSTASSSSVQPTGGSSSTSSPSSSAGGSSGSLGSSSTSVSSSTASAGSSGSSRAEVHQGSSGGCSYAIGQGGLAGLGMMLFGLAMTVWARRRRR